MGTGWVRETLDHDYADAQRRRAGRRGHPVSTLLRYWSPRPRARSPPPSTAPCERLVSTHARRPPMTLPGMASRGPPPAPPDLPCSPSRGYLSGRRSRGRDYHTGLPGCETGGCNHPFSHATVENLSELNSTYRDISGRGLRWSFLGGRPKSSVNYFVIPSASFGTRRAPTRSAPDSIDRARSGCLSRPRLQVRSVHPRVRMTHPAHHSAGLFFLRRAARGR